MCTKSGKISSLFINIATSKSKSKNITHSGLLIIIYILFIFADIAGSEVKFDRQGDGLARYDILNYQKNSNASGYYYRVSEIKIYTMYCVGVFFAIITTYRIYTVIYT